MGDMSEAAREAQNAYKRAWYEKNKDKQKKYNKTYWEKKAKEQAVAAEHINEE